MKVLALRHDLVAFYADTQVYDHDVTKDNYENAYLISNLTSHTIFYTSYSLKVLEILNKSGISAIIVSNEYELDILLKSNFTYCFNKDIVYLHDYSYYQLNEIRTDQYWLTKTSISEYLPPGWTITYVGPLGIKTRGHYNCNFICQNTATDDDIIQDYIYSEKLDFLPFLFESLNKRLTSSLDFDRLSNRIFRETLYSTIPKDTINVGPRNESMFQLLKYPKFRNLSNNITRIENLLKLPQEKWLGRENTQFDIGQYKNMCNVLSTIYYYYHLHHSIPKIYMLGSAPSHWIYDVNQYYRFNYETWDPLPTPFSNNHHAMKFTADDIAKLQDNSILYIDIRTDRGSKDWKEWRDEVEKQTLSNLDIMHKYLSSGRNRVCCCKMTAMDIKLPVNAILLHFPTTKIQSEYYIICTREMLDDMRFIPKGSIYAYVNNTLTDNVFIGPSFNLRKTNSYVLALYSLSNEVNPKHKVLQFLSKQRKGLITLRLNNSFDYACKTSFKSTFDYLYLPTEITADNAIITSYFGILPMYSLSSSMLPKPTGNNHMFIQLNSEYYYKNDELANHMGISRRSHAVRFSESATTLSGYMFRDLTNGKYNLIDTDRENSVSGHVYNALIYFRYNYTFDLKRWIVLHANEGVNILGGRYFEHAPPELLYACESALTFAKLQNDLTLAEYTKSIATLIHNVYNITYADNPNFYICIKFVSLPYEYDVKDVHFTGGLLQITDAEITQVLGILRSLKSSFYDLTLTTQYTYMLTDTYYVANVSGYLQFYYRMYMLMYRKDITFGQSRMYIPHITLSKTQKASKRIDVTKLHIKSITLKKIGSELEYQI